MKARLLASSVAALSLGSVSLAAAADLPSRKAPIAPAPIAALPVFTWSGLYIGGTAGGTFSSNHNSTYTYVDPLEGPPPSRTTFTPGGSDGGNRFVAGAEIGFNWQVGSFVYGLEGDINFAGHGNGHNAFYARRNCELTACAFGADGYDHFFVDGRNGFGTFGTIRGRLGLAYDRALFFVTGGLAIGGSPNTSVRDYRLQTTPTALATYARPADVVFTGTSNDSNAWGYALGGGIEYAFTNNWSAKVEYLYVNLRNGQSGALTASNANFGTLSSNSSRNSLNIVRAGLNYKFDFGSAGNAVVARY